MKTLIRNSFLGAMMATALMMSVATMAQNKVTGGRRPAGTTTQTTNSASTVSSQAKATNSNVSTKATQSTRTTAVSSNNSQSKVANTATTTQRRNDNNTTSTTASGSGTASGRRPASSTSAATTSGSVTRSNGATHWPSSNSVTVPSTSSSTSKTTSSTSGTRTNVGTSSSNVSTKSGSGTVSGGRRPTSESTVAGNISKDNSANKNNTRTNEGVGLDSRLNNNGGNDKANAGNISANSGIIHSGSGNTNIGGGRRPGVDNSNHNAASSHYELTNHRNYSTYNNNYRHNDWSRPLPPPVRQYRPAVRIITRPVMPTGFVIYNRAPRINTILGLSFGSYYNSSLNYLFTMGYDIDGYNRDVIYLRDVPMLRFTWADVMLSYDTYGRLYNAQFAHSTSYRDRSRFNRLYHDLYATYGTPVAAHITAYEASVTWFGGNAEGYVTLEFGTDTYGRYYTMVTVGY